MFLQSKHADSRVLHQADDAFEVAWYDQPTEGEALVVSVHPQDYPPIVVYTTKTVNVMCEHARLLSEGWVEN